MLVDILPGFGEHGCNIMTKSLYFTASIKNLVQHAMGNVLRIVIYRSWLMT
jgi:hypothetical protein